MAIDPPKTWIDTVNGLPPSKAAPKALADLASAVDACVTNKAQLTGIVGKPVFTFQKAIFVAGLQSLAPVPAAAAGVAKFVAAWADAVTASIMLVPSGSSFGPPSPPTLFSVVIATVLDPDSLVLARTTLQSDLLSQKPVKSSSDSDFGPALRRAFLSLTYTVTGLNSVPPPAGPLPLTAAKCALM